MGRVEVGRATGLRHDPPIGDAPRMVLAVDQVCWRRIGLGELRFRTGLAFGR